ncbi:M28 family peptidase [Parapedobacter pyrenivorans]|uniref:M28 family peptidase n=1 Tax=Parapedobacter pyrenivorans TaxID=1305674 RepID=UPI00333E4446
MGVRILSIALFFCLVGAGVEAQEIDKELLLNDIKTLSSDTFAGRKPGTQGHQRAMNYLTARFRALDLKDFRQGYLDAFEIEDRLKGYNVIGYIPGQCREAIVVSAHYDHLGERDGKLYLGADDNASGVSALLALAAYFSERTPAYTLIFVAFDAEEMGLRGANAFVNNPPIPLEHILLNINMDMVSRSDRNELYACGTYHYPHLSPFINTDNPVVTLKTGHDEPGSGHQDWTTQSDHAAFHRVGIPFIYFGVEDHPDYHTPNDTYEHIQPDFFYNAVLTIRDIVERINRNADLLKTRKSAR